MANTLFLWLEGPMQSWGERARWSVRDTATEPTKSGVVGLLACALGIKQDEDLRALSQQIHVGTRCDRPGRLLKDYQTIRGPWGTQISDRYYLCDGTFLVGVQSDDAALIERLADAVQNPVWPIFLGRKSCPPSCPPYAGVGDYPTLKAALESIPSSTLQERGIAQIRAVIECSPSEGTRRRDEVDSRSRRSFLPRHTLDVMLTIQVSPEVA
jgi:CRISPR system Cascade subunit CasD